MVEPSVRPSKLASPGVLTLVGLSTVADRDIDLMCFQNGKVVHGPPPASAAGNVVQATGLPTDQVINFMVTTAGGTTGWVLGFTPDGHVKPVPGRKTDIADVACAT